MIFKIYTIIPTFFDSCIVSVVKRAVQNQLLQLEVVDIKKYGLSNYHQVDDTPYGGGRGMVMRPDVLGACLEDNNILPVEKSRLNADISRQKLLVTSPRGRVFNQQYARHLAANYNEIHIVTNRFEAIDQRAIDYYGLEETSIGDYILAGGEPAALVILESITRLLNGVIVEESRENESFSDNSNILLEHDHYTKPHSWKNIQVPEILLSGHHVNIAKWRTMNANTNTAKRLKHKGDGNK